MADILFIKTSSLGDVIHHMPALTEARARRPDARFSWLVEQAFAPLVRLHPAVNTVVPVAWRRWRKSLWSRATLGEIGDNVRSIRAERYDDIIDTQGLLRSAAIARLPSGRRHGYDWSSIREPLASAFYDVRYSISRELHAVERNRLLTGRALGYEPQGAPDFGLDRSRLRRAGPRYAILLHATARPEKEWPEENWVALGKELAAKGYDLVLPWGSFAEKQRADRMAASLPRASVPERRALDSVATLMASAELVVGVDTGLMHLAAALGVPLVAIFSGSKPHLTSPVGNGPMVVLGKQGLPPTLKEVREAISKLPR
jgi:heptosyltransferase-1